MTFQLQVADPGFKGFIGEEYFFEIIGRSVRADEDSDIVKIGVPN